MDWIIRKETERDYPATERLVREAFWNLHAPGCDEHYLLHQMREHEDFIPELCLVAEKDGEIIGNIAYVKSKIEDAQGEQHDVLTFGPLSVLPAWQRKGVGKALIEASKERAKALGYLGVVIFGSPFNYVSSGFRSGKDYGIYIGEQVYPYALLVLEFFEGALQGVSGRYIESGAHQFDQAEASRFDSQFPPEKKGWQISQELFKIESRAVLR